MAVLISSKGWFLFKWLCRGDICFTSWYDVSHAMGFRVWGQNSIKNHSLTLLEINLCIKSGLKPFPPPPRQVYLFKVTVNLYFGGGTKARICWTTCRGHSKWRPVPWSVVVFLFQTGSKHTFVETKMERKYATEYSPAHKWASESLKRR